MTNGSSESENLRERIERLREHLPLVADGESLEIERGQILSDLCDRSGFLTSVGLTKMFQVATNVFAWALQPDDKERAAGERPIAFSAQSFLIRMPRHIRKDDDYRLIVHILGFELSEVHVLLRVICGDDLRASATCETVLTCVTPETRRIRPLPWQVHELLLTLVDAHRALDRPDYLGKGIAMSKRKSAGGQSRT